MTALVCSALEGEDRPVRALAPDALHAGARASPFGIDLVDVTVKVDAKTPLGPLRLGEDIFSGIIHIHSRFTKCT